MEKIKLAFSTAYFWTGFHLVNLIYWKIPLRFRLLKRRFVGFLMATVLMILFLKHIDYVFLEFAFSKKAGQGTIYEKIFHIEAKWYFKKYYAVKRAIWLMWGVYNVYFVLSTIFLSLYAYVGKYKEELSTAWFIGFMVAHGWFVYAYTFYTCQIHTIVLACFLYNYFYWIFHLIMWDEEMETYFENQADLAMVGRENFVHDPNLTAEAVKARVDNATKNETKDVYEYSTDERAELESGVKWDLSQSVEFFREVKNPYIDEKTLQLKGDWAEDGVVEAVWDLETRYLKHLETFYKQEEEELNDEDLKRPELRFPFVEEEIDQMMVFYLVFYPIRYWQDYRWWKPVYWLDYYRVLFVALYTYLKRGEFTRPKVVGPYSVYSPHYKFNLEQQLEWEHWKYLSLIWRFVKWVIKKFSIFYHYNNFRWFIFQSKFLPQKKKLQKRKSPNYRFFKTKESNYTRFSEDKNI